MQNQLGLFKEMQVVREIRQSTDTQEEGKMLSTVLEV